MSLQVGFGVQGLVRVYAVGLLWFLKGFRTGFGVPGAVRVWGLGFRV